MKRKTRKGSILLNYKNAKCSMGPNAEKTQKNKKRTTIWEKIEVANDIRLSIKSEKINPDGKYELKPVTQGSR